MSPDELFHVLQTVAVPEIDREFTVCFRMAILGWKPAELARLVDLIQSYTRGQAMSLDSEPGEMDARGAARQLNRPW